MSTSLNPAKIIMLGLFPPDVHQNVPVSLLPATRMSGIFSLAQQGLAGRMEPAGTGLAGWSCKENEKLNIQ